MNAQVSCPHCRYLVVDDGSLAGQEVFCPACNGRFFMPTPVGPAHWGARGPHDIDSLRCPTCGSDNFQRLSVIYEGGTSQTQSTSFGGGVMVTRGMHLGPSIIGASASRGSIQTGLAQSAAPPRMPHDPHGFNFLLYTGVAMLLALFPMVWLCSISGSQGLGSVMFLLWLVGIPLAVHALMAPEHAKWIKKHDAIFRKQYAEWTRTFMCHGCGQHFLT